MLNNKRGQLSDAMTWIVATLIIIIILLVFIYASSVLAEFKEVDVGVKSIVVGENVDGVSDWFNVKTNLAYEINNNNKLKIEGQINYEK